MKIFLKFFVRKGFFSEKFSYFCIVYVRASTQMGSDTTYWKSDTGRFVFGHLNYHNQIPFKDNAEVTPTGVYIRSRSVPRANHALIGTLLGAFCIYSSVGIYSVRSNREGCGRPKCQNGQV